MSLKLINNRVNRVNIKEKYNCLKKYFTSDDQLSSSLLGLGLSNDLTIWHLYEHVLVLNLLGLVLLFLSLLNYRVFQDFIVLFCGNEIIVWFEILPIQFFEWIVWLFFAISGFFLLLEEVLVLTSLLVLVIKNLRLWLLLLSLSSGLLSFDLSGILLLRLLRFLWLLLNPLGGQGRGGWCCVINLLDHNLWRLWSRLRGLESLQLLENLGVLLGFTLLGERQLHERSFEGLQLSHYLGVLASFVLYWHFFNLFD